MYDIDCWLEEAYEDRTLLEDDLFEEEWSEED